MPVGIDDADQITAKTRAQWRSWLSANHASSSGVWLILSKKHSGKPSVTYEESVEEALCFGWIDGIVKRIDDDRHRQWFTPRKSKSIWSALNKARVERLIVEKRMTAAGLAAIERAKSNGSWEALNAAESLTVPADLRRALTAHNSARQFRSFSPSARKAILYWIASAKKPETRERRVEQTARMAAKGLRAQFDQE